MSPASPWVTGSWSGETPVTDGLPEFLFLLVVTPAHDGFPQRTYLSCSTVQQVASYLEVRQLYKARLGPGSAPGPWYWQEIPTPTLPSIFPAEAEVHDGE